MKTYNHVIFWISLVMCILPTNTLAMISSFSPIIVLVVQFFWFFGAGAIVARSILEKEIPLESFLVPLFAMIIALNLNYFFGKQDARFIFQLAYIVFFTTFAISLTCFAFVLFCKRMVNKLFFKNKKPLY